jgi:hypothetical protein
MAKLFFTVLETLNIAGRGVSAITDRKRPEPTFRNGDQVELHSPDGRIFKASCCLEIVRKTDPAAPYYENYSFAFMNLTKSDVPPGTQVFQLKEHPKEKNERILEESEPEQQRNSA